MIMKPPAIESLGTTSGFSLRLEDRANVGPAALKAAEDKLIALASASPLLVGVISEGLPDGASVALQVDRQKAQAFGLSFTTINDTISTAIGSGYVNDFPNQGRMQQVIVQADAPARMHVEDVLRLEVRNIEGGMVPLSEVVKPVWESTPLQLARYNGYPAARISGSAAPGVSSGAAMDEMERLAQSLPGRLCAGVDRAVVAGAAVGQPGPDIARRVDAGRLSRAGGALRKLVDPAGRHCWWCPWACWGRFWAVLARGADNDVFFKVGLITIIGLSRQECHPDGRVCPPSERAGHEAAQGDPSGGTPAPQANPDDIARLHPGRGPADAGARRRLGNPERHRHRRFRWHGVGDAAGGFLRPGALCRRQPRDQPRKRGSSVGPSDSRDHVMINALILIIEDEPEIAEIIETYFAREGFRVICAGDGPTGLSHHHRLRPDLVVLDIKLPGQDGYDVLTRHSPARRHAGDHGHRAGRRSRQAAGAAHRCRRLTWSSPSIRWRWSPAQRQSCAARWGAARDRCSAWGLCPSIRKPIWRRSIPAPDPSTLDLTPTEFRILAHVTASPGRAFLRSELVDACLPEGEALDRTVDSHVSNLRRKLAAAGADGMLAGVRGVGYRMDFPHGR